VGLVAGSFGQDYRFHANSTGRCDFCCVWTFTDVVPGSYEIFATWPAQDNRPAMRPIGWSPRNCSRTNFADHSASILVNQKFSPAGRWRAGGLGQSRRLTRRDGAAVELGNNADGWVAADAVDRAGRSGHELPLTVKPGLRQLT